MQKLLPPQLKVQDLSDLNPEFTGIARNLGKSHFVRKQAERENKKIGNRINFLKKEEDSAEKKVMKKQKELETLMDVIARRQADHEKKEAQRQAREQALAQQRERNMRRRNEHQEKIRNAFLSLYDENHQNVASMRDTFRRNEQMRKSFNRQALRSNYEKALKQSADREQGRQRINSFHKERIDLFTSRYKEKIQQQEKEAKKLSQETQLYTSLEGQLKTNLQNRSSRIEALEEEIKKISTESKSLSANRSWNWSSLSKVHHEDYTRQESSKDHDSKLERLIEREMTINEE